MKTLRKPFILDIEPKQLYSVLKPLISEEYRIKQIIEWLYVKKASSFEKFSNLPKDIRGNLESSFNVRSFQNVIKHESVLDGTIRYTFKTYDSHHIYAVYLPTESTKSVCISTQIGCPVSCNFCSSGKIKYVRDLSRGEILEQIIHIENDRKERISGVLFMGMGEPLLNYKNLTSAIESIISKNELNIGKRHVTVSSVGIIPAVKNLANAMYGVRFALSLHATDDKQRKKIIPNNFDAKISELLQVCKYYLKKTNSRLTIEYIMLKGFNDTSADAHRLARLMRNANLIQPSVQVNLIPYNQVSKNDYQIPEQVIILTFKKILKLNGINVNIREAKGLDIGAACGQLGYTTK